MEHEALDHSKYREKEKMIAASNFDYNQTDSLRDIFEYRKQAANVALYHKSESYRLEAEKIVRYHNEQIKLLLGL